VYYEHGAHRRVKPRRCCAAIRACGLDRGVAPSWTTSRGASTQSRAARVCLRGGRDTGGRVDAATPRSNPRRSTSSEASPPPRAASTVGRPCQTRARPRRRCAPPSCAGYTGTSSSMGAGARVRRRWHRKAIEHALRAAPIVVLSVRDDHLFHTIQALARDAPVTTGEGPEFAPSLPRRRRWRARARPRRAARPRNDLHVDAPRGGAATPARPPPGAIATRGPSCSERRPKGALQRVVRVVRRHWPLHSRPRERLHLRKDGRAPVSLAADMLTGSSDPREIRPR
jgi:hypothetical protein